MKSENCLGEDLKTTFELAEEIVNEARNRIMNDKYLLDSIKYGQFGELMVQSLLLGYLCAKQHERKEL